MSYCTCSKVRQNAASQNRDKAKAEESAAQRQVSTCLVASRRVIRFGPLCASLPTFCCNCCCCCLTHRCLIVVVSHTFVACRERGNGAWEKEKEGVQQVLRNRLRFMHFLRHASCVGGFPPPPSTPRGVSLALSLALFCF